MPYRVKWIDQVVVFDFYGRVSAADLLSSNEDVNGDARFDFLRWRVLSLENVEAVAFEEGDLRKVAYLDMAAYRSNPRVNLIFVGDSAIAKDLYSKYSSFVGERCWPVVYKDRLEKVEMLIENVSGERFRLADTA